MLMKLWFVVFDLVTLALVLRLLMQTDRHRGWAIAYGWCPLVIKEIANSGHLDTLATCLMTLTISLLLSPLRFNGAVLREHGRREASSRPRSGAVLLQWGRAS